MLRLAFFGAAHQTPHSRRHTPDALHWTTANGAHPSPNPWPARRAGATKKDVLDQRRTATAELSTLRDTSPEKAASGSSATAQLRSSRLALGPPSEREPISRRMSRMTTMSRRQIVEGIQAASDTNGGQLSELGGRLDSLGLSSLEMEGDGNCQFRALADQLFGHQKHHALTRQAAVEQMRKNADFFGMYFEDGTEFTAYLRDMARSRTWGDELTLRAAVEAYGCCAHVLTTTPANWYLVYQPEGEPLTSLPLPKDADAPRRGKEIFISYISPIHYNAVQAR